MVEAGVRIQRFSIKPDLKRFATFPTKFLFVLENRYFYSQNVLLILMCAMS